jgi:hypothetical protein
MPLRQPPAEQPFSLIPPNWNPVSNDRVLPHLGLNHFAFNSRILFLARHSLCRPVIMELSRPCAVRRHNPQAVRTTDFVTLTVTVFVRLPRI